MAKKQVTAPSPAKPVASTTTSTPTPKTAAPLPPTTTITTPSKPAAGTLSANSSPKDIVLHVWNKYVNETPSRTMLLDIFMLFLVLNGGVQFVYCVLAGNYPFNAFLSGFSAAVGQFVLTASLRMQTTEQPPNTVGTTTKKNTTKTLDGVTGEFIEEGTSKISSERAFADFIFGSLILHAFCINFIN